MNFFVNLNLPLCYDSKSNVLYYDYMNLFYHDHQPVLFILSHLLMVYKFNKNVAN